MKKAETVKREDNILKVPVPGCIKFQMIFDNNEYLQKVLEQDQRYISIWYVNEDCDLQYLSDILNKAGIRFSIKKED